MSSAWRLAFRLALFGVASFLFVFFVSQEANARESSGSSARHHGTANRGHGDKVNASDRRGPAKWRSHRNWHQNRGRSWSDDGRRHGYRKGNGRFSADRAAASAPATARAAAEAPAAADPAAGEAPAEEPQADAAPPDQPAAQESPAPAPTESSPPAADQPAPVEPQPTTEAPLAEAQPLSTDGGQSVAEAAGGQEPVAVDSPAEEPTSTPTEPAPAPVEPTPTPAPTSPTPAPTSPIDTSSGSGDPTSAPTGSEEPAPAPAPTEPAPATSSEPDPATSPTTSDPATAEAPAATVEPAPATEPAPTDTATVTPLAPAEERALEEAPATESVLGPPAAVLGPSALPVAEPAGLGSLLNVARSIPWSAPGDGLRAGLSSVIEHVRDLARGPDGTGVPSGGQEPAPLPMPSAPLPTPPPLPVEHHSGSGSSYSGGSQHQHSKSGSADAVLGGVLLVMFLSPVGTRALSRFTGHSRHYPPLALPG